MNKLQEAAENAAQHLEAEPDSYKFMRCSVPESGKDRACAAGWFCYYLGYRGVPLSIALCKAVGMDYSEFQAEWIKLAGGSVKLAAMSNDPNKMAWLLRESAMTFLSDQETEPFYD